MAVFYGFVLLCKAKTVLCWETLCTKMPFNILWKMLISPFLTGNYPCSPQTTYPVLSPVGRSSNVRSFSQCYGGLGWAQTMSAHTQNWGGPFPDVSSPECSLDSLAPMGPFMLWIKDGVSLSHASMPPILPKMAAFLQREKRKQKKINMNFFHVLQTTGHFFCLPWLERQVFSQSRVDSAIVLASEVLLCD